LGLQTRLLREARNVVDPLQSRSAGLTPFADMRTSPASSRFGITRAEGAEAASPQRCSSDLLPGLCRFPGAVQHLPGEPLCLGAGSGR